MKATIIYCLLGAATADLRQASQPKRGYNLLQQNGGRGAKNFVVGTGQLKNGQTDTASKGKVLYMEPSVFGYQGLKQQRQNNYDNFLRSNIDNEQDNRNFNNEVGLDHLPFRTYENAIETTYPYKGSLVAGNADDSGTRGAQTETIVEVSPGEPKLTPLRWNNPHASELEVNLWITCSDPPTIVPVKKPACSGEGNQNNIVEWAIPSDFNDVNWAACPSTACFTGCNNPTDCVLQIYAHSVETRQYTTAFPILVKGAARTGAATLASKDTAQDWKESGNYALPKSYDISSMIRGTPPQAPAKTIEDGQTATLANVKICASHKRGGIDDNGNAVVQIALTDTPQILTSAEVFLYLCKRDALERGGEEKVDRVVFTVKHSLTGLDFADTTPPQMKVENYSPFEFSSEDHFGGAGFKEIRAVLTPYPEGGVVGAQRVITVKLDLREGAKRWRFRRHLQNVCPDGTLQEPFQDPWMDLSLLERETCLSAQDPYANYGRTTIQRAALHSDVANHAYQNSNYSPYSGQQHQYISRNLQAAAVIHMTTGNRGELGKNNLPKATKNQLNKLNNQINQLYKAYEKVANKVIDNISKQAGGKNGAGINLGVQPLATAFRAAEKGATSTKRLKTTTYVPSFNIAGYNLATAEATIKQRAGRDGKYADLLSDPKPGTGDRFIEIYQATMNKMLPAFAAAQKLGITYLPSVQMVPCKVISQGELQAKSAVSGKANQEATGCCKGNILNHENGGCGNTLPDVASFKKRNAANKKDGGQYASKTFGGQRYMTLYGCKAVCLNLNSNSDIKPGITANPVFRTAKASCITYLDTNGCQATKTDGSTDCTPCAGIFNNIAPAEFTKSFGVWTPKPPPDNLIKMITRVREETKYADEEAENVLKPEGDELAVDDTAVCHTPSTFKCPGTDADFLADVEAGKCVEEPSTKIDKMCDDGPCDNDPESEGCKEAKAKCEVDPDSGVLCMPDSENDPCEDCVVTWSSGNVAAVAAIPLVLLAYAL